MPKHPARVPASRFSVLMHVSVDDSSDGSVDDVGTMTRHFDHKRRRVHDRVAAQVDLGVAGFGSDCARFVDELERTDMDKDCTCSAVELRLYQASEQR